MLGRLLAGGAAGYLLTGDIGGAIGGAAMATAGRGIGKAFLRKRGGVAGLGQTALKIAGRLGPESPSMMKNSYSYFSKMAGEAVDVGALGKIGGATSAAAAKGNRVGRGFGIMANKAIKHPIAINPMGLTNIKQLGKGSKGGLEGIIGAQSKFIEQRGASFESNIQRGHDYLGQNKINVNKFGGYALGAMGMMAASRMGSNLINSNNGY